jgi:hypothetical protein
MRPLRWSNEGRPTPVGTGRGQTPPISKIFAWFFLCSGVVALGTWTLVDGLSTHEFGHSFRHTTSADSPFLYWLSIVALLLGDAVFGALGLLFLLTIIRRITVGGRQ